MPSVWLRFSVSCERCARRRGLRVRCTPRESKGTLMCGIVGIVHREPDRPVGPEAIRGMCDAIRHRGPDEEGLSVAGGGGVGVAALSINDLGGGGEGMFHADESALRLV